MGKKKKPEGYEETRSHADLSRRDFMTVAGLGVVGAAAAGRMTRAEPGATADPAAASFPLELAVNGRKHRLLVEARWSLLFVLFPHDLFLIISGA